MIVLITGGGGQLAKALMKRCPAGTTAIAPSHGDLDVTDLDSVTRNMERAQPALVINCAAYTAVDQAEAHRDEAFEVNAVGAGNVATAARRTGARMIQISTDFVFSGRQSTPYRADDDTAPVNVYGASKLAGEVEARKQYAEGVAIVRTSWLYAASGRNFVTTMLRLMQERDHLDVVTDQVGGPTWVETLADAIWRISEFAPPCVYHWSDAGVASWYDFALAIQEEAMERDLLAEAIPIRPIRATEFRSEARRPPYSVLDCSETQARLGIERSHWRTNLRRMLGEVPRA